MAGKKKFTKKPLSGFPKIKDNLLFYLAGFLAVFIPLYPKLPLADILPGYIVRLRLEDLFIFATFLVFVWQVYKQKINLRKNPLFWPIVAYLLVGFFSILSGIFITKTIYYDPLHIAKAFLHLARRVEYLSLFFIFYYAVRDKKQLQIMLGLVIVTVIGVIIYGYGQKYWNWPVYSTMNREFSKGVKLYLREHGRVHSTFGGHYDLAAYIMMMFTLLTSLFFLVKKKLLKVLFLILAVAVYWLLILTVSRASFFALVLAISILFLVILYKKSIWWGFLRYFATMTFVVMVMIFFGDLSDRLFQVLGEDMAKKIQVYTYKINPPPKESPEPPLTASDTLPEPQKEEQTVVRPVQDKSTVPADVYVEPVVIGAIPTVGPAAEATVPATVSYPTYSDNALKYGLSVAIRLDALWPRAIKGFVNNPLLGSGYSTLTKESVADFTYAESTDNDILRMLGETGLLGMFSFLGIIVILIWRFIYYLQNTNKPFLIALFASGIAICLGLLLNSVYIDVFEASKVAYTFWSLMGIILAAGSLVIVKTKK